MAQKLGTSKKAARQRYLSENRRLKKKRQRVLKSSRGKWTYEALVTHGKKREREALKRKLREIKAKPKRTREDQQRRRLWMRRLASLAVAA